MKAHILFADNLHFHERNFGSLMRVIKKYNISHQFNQEHRDWMALYGDYTAHSSALNLYYQLIKHKKSQDLYEFKYRDLPLYELVQAELMAYLLPQKALYQVNLPKDNRGLFLYLFEHHHLELCLNLSAAIFWIEFWYEKVIQPKRKFTHAFVFSGSNIYCKTLMKLCQFSSTRCIVAESSFTGNEYYLEERFSHIANNSDIKLMAFQQYYAQQIQTIGSEKVRHKALNKLVMSKNKNVTHPESNSQQIFFRHENKKEVLIVGQVLNDYSLIETPNLPRSSVLWYQNVLTELIEKTDCNIIFKAHPWEEKKVHCQKDITLMALTDWVKENWTIEQQSRLILTKDFNIHDLFHRVDHVVVLNSQAGIEAAYYGIKPLILGRAFYGQQGFTFDLTEVEQVAEVVRQETGRLTLAEWDRFEGFLAAYLEMHLFSIHASGESRIVRRFFTADAVVKLLSPPKVALKNAVVAAPLPLDLPEGVSINPEFSEAVERIQNSAVPAAVRVLSADEVQRRTPVPLWAQCQNAVRYLFTDFHRFKKKMQRRMKAVK